MNDFKKETEKHLEDAKEMKLPRKSALTVSMCLMAICIAVLLYLVIDYLFIHHFFNDIGIRDSGKLGTFGDFVGGILGTIVAIVTVILIWLTYQAQNDQILEMRKQNKEQIEIQALSALMVQYNNEIATLERFLEDSLYDSPPDYVITVVEPKRERLRLYQSLARAAENMLTFKVETLATIKFDLDKKKKI